MGYSITYHLRKNLYVVAIAHLTSKEGVQCHSMGVLIVLQYLLYQNHIYKSRKAKPYLDIWAPDWDLLGVPAWVTLPLIM